MTRWRTRPSQGRQRGRRPLRILSKYGTNPSSIGDKPGGLGKLL